MDDKIVLGADIGGSHITAGLVNLESRRLLEDSLIRKQIDSHETTDVIIKSWCEAIKEAMRKHDVVPKRIGISIPGPFDYENGISLIKDQDKYDALYGLNVKKLLAEALLFERENIKLINDAGCFLRGEVFGGAVHGFDRAIGLTFGTGLGTARYREGEAEDAALWKSSFKDSIAEDYLSARWFIKRYKELSGIQVAEVKEIVMQAEKNKNAKTVFNEFGQNLSDFLNTFIKSDEPETVLFGGSISKSYHLFSSALKKGLKEQYRHIPLKRATLGEKAALIGAASYWKA